MMTTRTMWVPASTQGVAGVRCPGQEAHPTPEQFAPQALYDMSQLRPRAPSRPPMPIL
jgi:hypothetical protein